MHTDSNKSIRGMREGITKREQERELRRYTSRCVRGTSLRVYVCVYRGTSLRGYVYEGDIFEGIRV